MSNEPVRRRRRATNVESHEGTITVRRTQYGGDAEESQESVRVPLFETEPARLRVHGSVTRNMGDFNSVRVEVMLELPVLPEMSEVDRVYGVAERWVEARLQQELDQAINRDDNDGRRADQEANQGQGQDQAAGAGVQRRVSV